MVGRRSHIPVWNLITWIQTWVLSVQVPVKETAPLSEYHPGHPGCTRHPNCLMQTLSEVHHFKRCNWSKTWPSCNQTLQGSGLSWASHTVFLCVSRLPSVTFLFNFFMFHVHVLLFHFSAIIEYLEESQNKWLAVSVVSLRAGCVGFRSRVYIFIKACKVLRLLLQSDWSVPAEKQPKKTHSLQTL